MTLEGLICAFSLRVLCGEADDTPVSGCYIGDLLSRVMGQAQKSNVWLTIMSGVDASDARHCGLDRLYLHAKALDRGEYA